MHALRNLAVVLLVAAAAPAWSGDDHEHAGKHGGVIVESGHHHFEVVAKDGELVVHVEGEHGTPEMVSGAKATAAVLSGGKKVDVELQPAGGTILKGTGAFKAGKGTVIVLTVTMPEHEAEQVRVELE